MKTPLICDKSNVSDAYLKRFFSWLTRIGAAPKFGTCNIAHYQACQCAALRALENSKAAGFPLRCKGWMIQYKPTVGDWQDVINAHQLRALGEGHEVSIAPSSFSAPAVK